MYWFVDHERKLVGEIVPAKSVKRSECVDFGGWCVDEPDLRPFAELSQSKNIFGLKMNEGGAGLITVRGQDLYENRLIAQRIGHERGYQVDC